MTTAPVFESMDRFGLVHHRALNSPSALDSAIAASLKRDDLCHVLEGDICWLEEGGRHEAYFRHPKLFWDTLRPDQIDAGRDSGALLTLEAALERIASRPDLRVIIEIKHGRGDARAALSRIAGVLRETISDRYWFDGFSSRLLRLVKLADPKAPTSLHTKAVLHGCVLRSAPEFAPLSVHRIARINHVDAITLTYSSSLGRCFERFGATIDRSCRSVLSSGKALILGGLTKPEHLALAQTSSAKAGYVKFPFADVPRVG